MLTLDGTATARAAAAVAGIHYLVDIAFSSGTLYFTTHALPISHGGQTYTALGDLLEISGVQESEDQGADKLEMSFTIVNAAMLAALIGPATVYRNKRVRLFGQLISDTYQPAGAAVLRWAGFTDVPRVERESPPIDGGFAGGKIILPCWRAGVARMRNANSLRRTHAQQLQRTAGADTGLRYTQQLIEQPQLWLSTRFQQV